jgi:hypothetical protein
MSTDAPKPEILVIDDEVQIRRLLTMTLKEPATKSAWPIPARSESAK